MDNPIVIQQLAIRASGAVLNLLSKISGIRERLAPELENQHIWYLRALELDLRDAAGRPVTLPEWDDTLDWNWSAIYNPLEAINRGGSLASSRSADLNGYRLLIHWGYFQKDDAEAMRVILGQTARYGDAPTLTFLLDHFKELIERDKYDVKNILANILWKAVEEGNESTVHVLVEYDRERMENEGESILDLQQTLLDTVQTKSTDAHVRILKYLWEELLSWELEKEFMGQLKRKIGVYALSSSQNNVATVQLLVSLGVIDFEDEDMVTQVLTSNRVNLYELFLSEHNPSQEQYLESATIYRADRLVKVILLDPRITTKDIQASLKMLVFRMEPEQEERAKRSLFYLLTDPRVGDEKDVGEILLKLKGDIEKYSKLVLHSYHRFSYPDPLPDNTGWFYETVSRVTNLQLHLLPRELVSHLTKWSLSRIKSQTGRALIEQELPQLDRPLSFETDHYEMFLLEVLIRPFSPEHYISWLTEQIDSDLRTMFYLVAQSILRPDRPIRHNSPEFTAYSGFLLFLVGLPSLGDETADSVFRVLESEDASDEGINKCAALIVAALERSGSSLYY